MVVPYIGTWIETTCIRLFKSADGVVPYIGTWIETGLEVPPELKVESYLI